MKSILQIPFDLIEDILRSAPKENSTGFGVLALSHEGEILVSELLDFEFPSEGADVGFFEFLGAVYDGGAAGAGEAVVVALAESGKIG